jgi:catechol 2,3-dioxygenase-like lactoylglutathione lyase family enzyme
MLATEKLMAFLCTNDARAARAFYEGQLGLRVVGEDDFALELDANGTAVRLQKGTQFKPARATALGWQVDDIESAVARLAARGVAFAQYGLPGQDEKGIWTAPATDTPSGGARVAWFHDPDGNVLSLTQYLEAR